eukprot:9284506-Pyramimonas_sp.AAC.1
MPTSRGSPWGTSPLDRAGAHQSGGRCCSALGARQERPHRQSEGSGGRGERHQRRADAQEEDGGTPSRK